MGRYFTDHDTKDAQPVVIIDDNMARTYWPDGNPIGRRLKLGDVNSDDPWKTIVGVVRSVKQYALETDSRVVLYRPHSQLRFGGLSVVVRTNNPTEMAANVRREARELDPNLAIFDVKTMEEWLSGSMARRRFAMLSLVLFAVVAMLLSAVGIYGVMSYTVAQRTRELGIRVALGAQARDVLRLIVSQGMLLAGIGLGIGLAGAVALTRVMSSLLFGVSATDPITFAVIALALAGVAFVACWVPARRATKVDPLVALRYE
jgi:putative ABC transport system permease protein